MTDPQIYDFWNWFLQSHKDIKMLVEQENARAINDLVGPRVAALRAGLGWEIGPEGPYDLFFAFALNGLRENIINAQRLVDKAPEIEGWHMHAGKPPRDWKGRFFMLNSLGQEVEIDASQWSYVLTGYDGNSFFDVQLLADLLPSMDELAKKKAAATVIEMQLGEKFSLEIIGDAQLTSPTPANLVNKSTPIAYLSQHLAYLVSNS